MVEVRAGVSEGGAGRDGRRERLRGLGLHFCGRYRNLVRFDPEFCGSCPFNGMKVSSGASGRS